jgi:hypothetical protein
MERVNIPEVRRCNGGSIGVADWRGGRPRLPWRAVRAGLLVAGLTVLACASAGWPLLYYLASLR